MPPAIIGGLITGGIGLATSLIGGKKAGQAATSNVDFLKSPEGLGSFLSTGIDANALAGSLLGVGGDTAGASNALNTFFDTAGGSFILDQGSRAITGSNAAAGLLNSGDTLKALTEFGSGVGSTFFQQFLNNVLGLGDQGLAAGSVIGGAGIPAASDAASIKGNQFSGIAQSTGTILGSIFKNKT